MAIQQTIRQILSTDTTLSDMATGGFHLGQASGRIDSPTIVVGSIGESFPYGINTKLSYVDATCFVYLFHTTQSGLKTLKQATIAALDNHLDTYGDIQIEYIKVESATEIEQEKIGEEKGRIFAENLEINIRYMAI